MASNWISDISWDEQGRPYRVYLMDGPGYRKGERTYVSPAEVSPQNTSDVRLLQWAEQNRAPSASLLKDRGTWNSRTGQWDRGANWGNIASLGVGGLIGAPYLAAALGGGSGASGAAAGGGTLSASSVPVSASMYGPAAIASQGASAGIPLGGVTAATAGAGAAGAAGAGASGGALKKVADILSNPATQIALAAGLPFALGAGPGQVQNASIPPELQKYLGLSEARIRRVDPLHQAAVQMAWDQLPTYGREGITMNKVPLP